MINKQTIAITGASGFVGYSTGLILKQRGYKIIEFSRSKSCLGEFQEYQLSDERQNFEVLKRCDAVIHCAAAIDLTSSQQSHVSTMNFEGSKRLFDNCIRYGVKHVINISSGAVYGYSDAVFSESMDCKPNTPYGESKYLSEVYLNELSGLRKTNLRLFFPYGPRQQGRLVSELIRKILLGNKIVLNQNGKPHITPIYIDDVANIIYKVIENQLEGTYNLAGSEVISILDLAQTIADLISSGHLVYEFNESNVGDLKGDNRKIVDSLTDIQFTDLISGLKSTVGK